jgi:glucose uptake protein GlcU
MDFSQIQQLSEQISGNQEMAQLFDMKAIVAMLFFSTVGIFYYKKGKRDSDILYIISGVVLFLYGYFVYDFIYLVAIGLALSALPYLRRFL